MKLLDRKKTRLEDYDYSLPGAYFVTLCVQDRKYIFEAERDTVGNDLCVVPPVQNRIIRKWLAETENKFGVTIDKWCIMPDHIHLIVVIKERHAGRSLHDIIQWFKTMVTNEYIRYVKQGVLPAFNKKLWQKTYYDHIIRGENDYAEIWQYIENNPMKLQFKKKNLSR